MSNFIYLMILIVLSFSVIVEANECFVTDAHFEQAKSQIQKLGFNPKSLKKTDLKIFSSCSNGICDESTPQKLIVDFTVESPTNVKNIELQEGNRIRLCDGRLSSLSLRGKNTVEGYKCQNKLHFDSQEKLCYCSLREDSIIEGIKVPGDSDLHLYKGRPYAVNLRPITNASGEVRPRGYYKFEKGELAFQKDWDSLNTCGDFIHTQ